MSRQEDPRRKTGHSSEDVSKKCTLESTLKQQKVGVVRNLLATKSSIFSHYSDEETQRTKAPAWNSWRGQSWGTTPCPWPTPVLSQLQRVPLYQGSQHRVLFHILLDFIIPVRSDRFLRSDLGRDLTCFMVEKGSRQQAWYVQSPKGMNEHESGSQWKFTVAAGHVPHGTCVHAGACICVCVCPCWGS